MMRLVMWGLLAYIAYRIIGAILQSGKKSVSRNSSKNGEHAASTYRDPVCGVYVSEDDAVIGRLNGERHYFCSRECLDKFQEQLEHR